MTKKVLFSAVGGTDPISNFRDGSLLHICRFYKPDIIYLYLSKEIYEFHKKDNRYLYCLEKLSERIGHDFEIKMINKPDLMDVHVFDFFIKEFRETLKEIYQDEKGGTLYLNVSSGTPAMKSSLQFIAALQEIPMIPIQVKTSEGRLNPHSEDKINYDYKEYWELNEDNNEPTVNRCSVSGNLNLIKEIKKEMLCQLIDEYDYVAANVLLREMPFIRQKSLDLVMGACKRLKLDYNGARLLYKKWDYPLLPAESGDKAPYIEYMLWLELKLKKEEYADFVRGITPIIVKTFELLLKRYCKIDINNFSTIDKDGIRKWSMRKLENTPQYLTILNEAFRGEFKGGIVYSIHLLKLINAFISDENLENEIIKIREFEEEVRNHASHEIVSVTKEWTIKKTEVSPESIFKTLKHVFNFTGIHINDDAWNSYQKMNQIIKESFDEE